MPNALSLCGTPIDLGKITQPLYTVAAEDDHIAPWRSVAHINRLVPAPKRGVLSSSGHIMGIINPPRPDSRRSYRVGDVETTDTWKPGRRIQPGAVARGGRIGLPGCIGGPVSGLRRGQ